MKKKQQLKVIKIGTLLGNKIIQKYFNLAVCIFWKTFEQIRRLPTDHTVFIFSGGRADGSQRRQAQGTCREERLRRRRRLYRRKF